MKLHLNWDELEKAVRLYTQLNSSGECEFADGGMDIVDIDGKEIESAGGAIIEFAKKEKPKS